MKTTVSIARTDVYTSFGQYDTTIYEVLVDDGDDFRRSIIIDSADELMALNNALSDYIAKNGISATNISTDDHEQ